MAPVNPEGQTARDLTAEEIEAIHAWATVLHSKGCPKDASLLRRAVDQIERYAAQPSEGQTAQEARRAALEEAIGLAVADRRFEEQRPVTVYSLGVITALHRMESRLHAALASTPSPAKQEQKIASAEGAASQSGAAPATRRQRAIALRRAFLAALDDRSGPPVDVLEAALGSEVRIAAAPAQPDARDAEIAQLKSKGYALRGDAARLTKELEEAKTKLAHAENARDARQNEREEQRAKAAKANRRADAAEAEAKALREALEGAQGCIVRAARALALAAKGEDIDNSPLTLDAEGWARRSAEIASALMDVDAEITARLDALAPPEPKAETPAETAGQKEGP